VQAPSNKNKDIKRKEATQTPKHKAEESSNWTQYKNTIKFA
jgi:hypothetical protein